MFEKKKAVRGSIEIAKDVQAYFVASVDELAASPATLEQIRDSFLQTLGFAATPVVAAVSGRRLLAQAKRENQTADISKSGPTNAIPTPGESFSDRASQFLFGENQAR